jgi:hypothetical protein
MYYSSSDKERQDHAEWLKTIKVGCTVMIDRHRSNFNRKPPAPYKISRMTAKQGVIADGDLEIRFNLSDGSIIGDKFCTVGIPTEQALKRYRDYVIRLRIKDALGILERYHEKIDPEWAEAHLGMIQSEADRIDEIVKAEKAEEQERERVRQEERRKRLGLGRLGA